MTDNRDDIKVIGISTAIYNPFGADAEELVAAALDEAGLLSPDTSINGRPAVACLDAYRVKHERYQEVTRLGTLLVRRGVLDEKDLEKALSFQRERDSMRLGEALVSLEICSEDDVRQHLEAQGMLRDGLADLDEFRKQIDSIKERLRLYL